MVPAPELAICASYSYGLVSPDLTNNTDSVVTKYIVLLVLSAILPLSVVNSQVPDSAITLPEITVTATRFPVSVADAPVRIQILDRYALEQSAAPTVGSLLGLRTTLYVRSYGGVLSSMSQRGSTASQTLVLMDGTPIVSPTAGQLDLSLLPLSLINSVEVISGASSTLYGSNAVGGVVNLLTASTTPTLRFRTGVGSWGRRTASVYGAGKRGAFSGMLSLDFLHSDGNFRYLNQGLSPKRFTSREGADQNRQSIMGSIVWEGLSTQIRVSSLLNKTERGVPTVNATTSNEQRQWDESMRIWTQITENWSWGSLQTKVQVEDSKSRFVTSAWSIDDTVRYFDAISEFSLRFTDLASWHLVTGLSGGYTNVRNPNLKDGVGLREYKFAAYLSGSRTFGSVIIFPSVRLDGYEKDRTTWAFTPKLGVNVALNSSSTLNFKSSAGRAFRMPTFNDRFYAQSQFSGGNPDLRPEHGWSFDAGIIWTSPMIEAELTAFSLHMTDQIVWQPNENFYWSPSNVLEVANRGLEASLKLETNINPDLRINSSALWTFTDSRGTGEARLVPNHQIKVLTDIQWRFIALQVGARYSGTQLLATVQEDGITKLDPIFLADTQVRLNFDPVTVRLLFDNVLDNHYEYVPGNPMAPRSVRLDLGFSLR